MRLISSSVFVLIILGCILTTPVSAAELITGGMDHNSGPGTLAVPYVTGTTHSSTVIRWYPGSFIPDNLLYANESFYLRTGSYDQLAAVNKTLSSPMILLAGLESGTRYHYILHSGTFVSSDRNFSTYPESGPCSFIIYGDTREQAPYFNQLDRHEVVADRIAQEPDISFAVNTGDLVSNPDDYQEWDRFFKAGSMLFGITTYSVVRGNHDSNLSWLQYHFGTSGTESWDCGDVHVAILDSNGYSRLTLPDQARWLAEDLASTDKWKIVILHHPLYTSVENHYGGFENLKKVFEPVFRSGNVSVVFNGHVHAYERIEKSGVIYITEGRGGAPAYRLNETKVNGSESSRENTLGYSRVTFDPKSGAMWIDVIQVAEVSPDLRNVTSISSEDTVIERIVLRKPGHKPDSSIPRSLWFPQEVILCRESYIPTGQRSLSEQFPFCISQKFTIKQLNNLR